MITLTDMLQEELEATKGKPDIDVDPIEDLAKLSALEYDKVREAESKTLGIRVGTLDAEVAKARGQSVQDNQDGVVEELDPWTEPVDGLDLINEIAASLALHVALPSGACAAIALWVIGTYCMDAWRLWPKMLITSPEKRCGKSTLLEAMEGTCYRPLLTASITASSLFRCIAEWTPTLLIDEADCFAEADDALNGILNAGHTKRTAAVIRSEKVGDTFKPQKFSVWCPQVIAGIKSQRDTLHDRSIHIQMRRKLPGESVQKMPFDYFEQNQAIRRRCLRWATDNIGRLKTARPKVPNLGNDRAQDNWQPLFAIADLVGGDWPDRVSSAYRVLSQSTDDDTTIGPMVLLDIQSIFDEKGVDRLWSEDLVDALIALEERPWCEWKRGKPLTKNSLSRLLKPFKVRSGDIRFGQVKKKGYKRENFADVWKRYLAQPEPPISSATTRQASHSKGFSPISKRDTDDDVAFQKTLKAKLGAGCRVVADENGVIEDEGVKAGYPPELFDAATTACVDQKQLSVDEFISELEVCDYQEIINDPDAALAAARSMNARK